MGDHRSFAVIALGIASARKRVILSKVSEKKMINLE
jgi:hypothetical protein